jgi:GTP-binding protein
VARISAARPRVADYPFTTLEPTLGVVRYGDYGSFVITDLPGLIEGASEGHGLGHRFLRHTERTSVLLHLVSMEPGLDPEDPLERYSLIHGELQAYDPELARRPTLIGLSKIDTVSDREMLATQARHIAEATGHTVLPLSAVSGEGIDRLVDILGDIVTRTREERR